MSSEIDISPKTKMPEEQFEQFLQDFEAMKFDGLQLGKLYVVLNRKLGLLEK